MSGTITVTLRPARTIDVTLRVGFRPPLQLADNRTSVMLAQARVFVGPPGKPTLIRTRTYISVADAQPNADMDDVVSITRQAEPLHVSNPSHAAALVDGHRLVLRIRDNGTSQDIVFGALYRGFSVPLPNSTVSGKTMYLGFVWNAADEKWDLIAFTTQI